MRGVLVFFTLIVVGAVLAAVGAGIYYYFRRKRDNRTPPRGSHYPSPSFNSGATRIQTHLVYTPSPPPVSYSASSYRPPQTYSYSQTTPKATTPPSPDYGRGSYHSSVASPPPAQKPSQPRLPSTRTQPSPTLTQPPFTRTQPSVTRTQPPFTHTQPSVTRTQSPLTHTQPSPTRTQPSLHVPPRETNESERRLPATPAVASPRPRPDELATVEDLDFAQKLREQARRRGMEMTEEYSRAKMAQKKGLRGVAQEHRQRGHTHKSAMKELDKRAAEIIFREKNKVCSYMSLDMCSRLFSNPLCLRILRRE